MISHSLAETQKTGKLLAQEILRTKTKKALVVGLNGELGGGKTAFVQGLARGLKTKEKPLSPTFIIFNILQIQKSDNFKNLYHFDCYRINDEKEILNLGFDEIVSNPENVVVVEWADRIKKIIPKDALMIKFKFIDEKTRKISFSGSDET